MTREEAKREMLFAKREVMQDSWIDKAYDVVIKALEQPELTRCRDCKHYRQYNDQDDLCVYTMTSVEADDYCSYADRREDAERKNNV